MQRSDLEKNRVSTEAELAYQREHYRKNREMILARRRAYAEKYPERILAKRLRYRSKDLANKKAWYIENKEACLQKQRKSKYGITPLEHDRLYQIQGGKCAICGIHQTLLKQRLYIDHNHATGKVRGLLCGHCNSLLGYSRENIENLKKAIEYIGGKNAAI